MDAFIRYMLISTICLSIFYLGYLFFMRRETRYDHLRYFLLISMLLSLLIPLSRFELALNYSPHKISQNEISEPIKTLKPENTLSNINPDTTLAHKNAARNREKILLYSYLLGVCLLLFRLMVHIISIIRLYINSDKVRHSQVTLLINHRLKNSFSFFRWIFIPNEFSDGDEKDHIIIHERIHALQYHSVDLLLIELLSAVMWFNPLVWMMKKSVQLVHEYLADKGVLSTGIDKIRYQALLINHVAEERLICLSSGFNPVSQPGRYSLIKKRMIMMTKSKLNHGSKLKLWILIPLAAILFTGVACINGKNRSHVVTAVAPVKMNVLYLGLDNPVKIAASGYDASELTVTMENGRISGENG